MKVSELADMFLYIGVIGHMLIDVATLRTDRVCRHLDHNVGDVGFCGRFKVRFVGILMCIYMEATKNPNRSTGMSLKY